MPCPPPPPPLPLAATHTEIVTRIQYSNKSGKFQTRKNFNFYYCSKMTFLRHCARCAFCFPCLQSFSFFFLFCFYGCIESAQLLVFMCVILISTKDIAALCAKIWKNSALVPTYLIWEFFCHYYLISASTLRSVLKCKIYCLANKDVMYLLVT